jgi:riboflavin synthase
VFTGIVEELGEVVSREDLGDSARLVIRGPVVTSDAGHGDSIAVNGVCLTVVDVLADGSFSADVMAETLQRSSLREAVSGRFRVKDLFCTAPPPPIRVTPAKAGMTL